MTNSDKAHTGLALVAVGYTGGGALSAILFLASLVVAISGGPLGLCFIGMAAGLSGMALAGGLFGLSLFMLAFHSERDNG